MAGMVDLRNGKIIGVEKYSYSWYHEKGHLEYAKSPLGIRLTFYMESFFILTVAFLILPLFFSNILFKLLPLSSMVLFGAAYFFEEAWCWSYAIKKFEQKQPLDKFNHRKLSRTLPNSRRFYPSKVH